MRDENGLTVRQRRFADLFIELGDATKAAKAAGYSNRTAYSIGCENLRKPEIKGYLVKRMGGLDESRIASSNEVLELLTAVLRGEVPRSSISDRVRAAEQLGRYYGLWANNLLIDTLKPVVISGELSLE